MMNILEREIPVQKLWKLGEEESLTTEVHAFQKKNHPKLKNPNCTNIPIN